MQTNLDIDLLRAFVAVADYKNFTRASESLSRTQSAVSMQIKRLEQLVDKSLFNRNGRLTTLTTDGEFFLNDARRLVCLNDEVVNRFRQPEMSGTVRVGTPDDYASYFLPSVLTPYSRDYPNVRIEVSCKHSRELLKDLQHGRLDLALVTQRSKDRTGQRVFREPLFWVGSDSYDVNRVESLPLALFPKDCLCRDITLQSLKKAGRRWHIAFESHSVPAIISIVTSGTAISVLQKSIMPSGVRILTKEKDGLPNLPMVDIAIHQSNTKTREPVKKFIDLIKQMLGS